MIDTATTVTTIAKVVVNAIAIMITVVDIGASNRTTTPATIKSISQLTSRNSPPMTDIRTIKLAVLTERADRSSETSIERKSNPRKRKSNTRKSMQMRWRSC